MNCVSMQTKIRERIARITVLGLGHVGLPTALVFAREGFNVTGVDIDRHKVATLEQGQCSMREPGIQDLLQDCLKKGTFHVTREGLDRIRSSDFVFISVPTPVRDAAPDLRHFRSAFRLVERGLHKAMAILIQSTVPPLTTTEFVAPRVKRLGYAIDHDVFLAYCLERLAPTHALSEFVNNTRIVGGVGPNSSQIAAELFNVVCHDVRITDAATAELCKLAENTYRDLNIAYANLLALIAERMGSDAHEIIELANTHPRVTIHHPGIGVGGPCLPKDPYMLINDTGRGIGQLIRLGRELNDGMPKHVVKLLTQTLAYKGTSIRGARVAILGVTYKAEVDDLTNSPTKAIVEELMKRGAKVTAYDPHSAETFGAEKASSLEDALKGSSAVLITVAHKEFKSIDPIIFKKVARGEYVVFDGPRLLDPAEISKLGLTYLSVGFGTPDTKRYFQAKG